MKAAIVTQAGANPVYGDFAEPVARADQFIIEVKAAALSPLTRGRAAGSHYSALHQYPQVVGVDGVGTLGGQRVYFVLPEPPYGSMAERVAIVPERCVMLPEGLDDVAAAAIANPGMSSWAALRQRAKLMAGETVLINGATGSAGSLAVQIARHLGAKKIVATGRNPAALQELGADVTISLAQEPAAFEAACREQFALGVDVVLDYLWGASAETLLVSAAKTAKDGVPLRYVEIGAASGGDIKLPGAVLRASAISLMGSGIGSVSMAHLLRSIEELFQAAAQGPGFAVKTRAVPLSGVEQAWKEEGSGARTVFTL